MEYGWQRNGFENELDLIRRMTDNWTELNAKIKKISTYL
jgi:hypothetical protein